LYCPLFDSSKSESHFLTASKAFSCVSVIFARDFFLPHNTSNNSCLSKCFALPVPAFVASLNTFCIAVLSHLVREVAKVVLAKSSKPSHFIFIPLSHGTFLIALNTEFRASVEDTFGRVSAI
jgi:hypothetical protein